MADLADAELLLPLTKFLTADKCAAACSTAVQTTGTLAVIFTKMKTLIISILTIFLFFGCSLQKNEIKDIEFMAYTYSIYKENSNEITNLYIKCRIYSIIDTTGKIKVYVKRTYPVKEILHYESILDKDLVKNMIRTLDCIQTKKQRKEFDPKNVKIYDGPSLKILLNYKNKTSKSVGYIDEDTPENHYLYAFYHAIDSTYIKRNFRLFTDTIEFEKKRNEFIKISFKDDTTYLKPPPMSLDTVNEVRYEPQIENK